MARPRLALAKAAASGAMTAPVDARGDFGAIEGIVSKLQSAHMKSVATEDATDLKQYGLDKPSLLVTISLGSARAGFALGTKSRAGDYFARDVSKNQVVTVAADMLTDLQKSATDLRRKDVFEFRTFNLSKIEITRGADHPRLREAEGQGQGRRRRVAECGDKKGGRRDEVRRASDAAVRPARAVVRRCPRTRRASILRSSS